MSKITLHNIESLKNEAKKVSKSEPGYSRELNNLSKLRFNVRDFHEAKSICKKNILQYFKESDGIKTCSYCGFSYKTNDALDTKKHNKVHLIHEKEKFNNNTINVSELIDRANNSALNALLPNMKLLGAYKGESIESITIKTELKLLVEGGVDLDNAAFVGTVQSVKELLSFVPDLGEVLKTNDSIALKLSNAE